MSAPTFHIDRYGTAHTTVGCPEYHTPSPEYAAPPVPLDFIRANRVPVCADCEPITQSDHVFDLEDGWCQTHRAHCSMTEVTR